MLDPIDRKFMESLVGRYEDIEELIAEIKEIWANMKGGKNE